MDIWLPPKPAIIRPAPADLRQDWRREPKKANFLPGWFPAGAVAGAPLTLSFVTSVAGGAGANSITAPATIEAGDVMVVFNCARGSGGIPTTAIPSGFTEITNVSAADAFLARAICSYKIAVGNEDGTTLNGMTVSGIELDPTSMLLFMFRGSRPVTSVTIGDADSGTITTGSPPGQTVTASGGTAPLIVFGAFMSDETIDGYTFTPTGDATGGVTGPNQHMQFEYGIFNTSPQDVSVSNSDEGGDFNGVQSFYLAMAG